MAAADAGADLLQSLRLERKTTPEATAVLLHGEDGSVRVHRMLASLLSPVLRRIVSPVAGIHQPERLEYLLPHHTVALLDFALDFCCGDPLRIIIAENALPLLALADELCLETLRTACEKHLIEDCLVSTNAEQLRVEAERYNAHALLAAVQNAEHAETGRLTQLSLERSSVYTKLAAAERERADKLSLVELLSRKLSMVEMKRAHELEQLFQKKSSRPPQVHGGSRWWRCRLSTPHAPPRPKKGLAGAVRRLSVGTRGTRGYACADFQHPALTVRVLWVGTSRTPTERWSMFGPIAALLGSRTTASTWNGSTRRPIERTSGLWSRGSRSTSRHHRTRREWGRLRRMKRRAAPRLARRGRHSNPATAVHLWHRRHLQGQIP